MTSILWYSSLGVIGIALAAFTIYKQRKIYKVSTLLVFYLYALCITWIGEFIVLGVFNGYAYKPGIFSNQWLESLTGHLILNTTLWPGSALFIAAFSLGNRWISLFTAFFVLAEYLFDIMDIYDQHWWTYPMSTILVIVYLLIVKYWFGKMNEVRHGVPRTLTFYFIGMLLLHLPSPFLLIWWKESYYLNFVENLTGDMYLTSIIIIFTYHLIHSVLLTLFVCVPKKWYWKLVPFIITPIVQSTFYRMGILRLHNGWTLFYSILCYLVAQLIFLLIENYTLKPEIFAPSR